MGKIFLGSTKLADIAPVTSVNDKTGAVSLTYSDVGAAAAEHTHSQYLTSAPVTSVNSKTGDVSLSAADVGAKRSSITYITEQDLMTYIGTTGLYGGEKVTNAPSTDWFIFDVQNLFGGYTTVMAYGVNQRSMYRGWYAGSTWYGWTCICDETYGPLTLSGGTTHGEIYDDGSHHLWFRHLDGSTNGGMDGALYLNYSRSAPIHVGSGGSYTISADGSYYSGTSYAANYIGGCQVLNADPGTDKAYSLASDGGTNPIYWTHRNNKCVGHLGRGGDCSNPMTFNWAGLGGTPSWLWGGEDGTNMYVYSPSNFSVNAATYAYYTGNADPGTATLKNTYAGTGAMTSGSTGLASGTIYLQYT